ncbi:MCE family protein [Pseudonocardia bannensis]|uniref:MCE family protein n=1 Tax=Pseudonocardia bannensis TaxID=630973 RepID=A0A848DPI3_9PSEU|nr:MCE family protein [Pseudonocardia bannensis]NMH94419.1 MCE family protein [Pseudonocardia bannensis]
MAAFGKRGPIPVAIIGLLVIALVTVLAFNFKPIFAGGTVYQAEFSEAAGLQPDDMVAIAGVEAGRVTDVALAGDRVLVTFRVDDAWVGDRTSASIEVRTLLGSKYLALDPQGEAEQDPDTPIALARTAAPFDVVEAFNGLSATVDELDTAQLANSLQTLSETFRDTAPEVRGALDGLSRLSTTIAGRDEQIRELLAGTRNISGVLADRNDEFEKLLSDGNLLLAEVQKRKEAISALLDGTRELSVQLRGLVADNRDQLRPTLEALDRVADVLQRNRDNLDDALRLEAVFVRLFTNAVGSGRWIDNYVCGMVPLTIGPINPRGC